MTSRHTSLGGTSGPDYAILLCFLAGIVELSIALLRLGALVDLISLPVTVGFTSATTIIIGSSQLKALLGIKDVHGSSTFVGKVPSVFSNLHKATLNSIEHILTIISTARNALLVFITSFIAFSAGRSGSQPFVLTGSVPRFGLPKFETEISGPNGTMIYQGFSDMVSELGPSIIVVPIIAVLGNVAIAKAFGGAGLNPTKELVALSFSNLFGSLCSAFPMTGSFSRSAVNHASGVRTPFGGFYTGTLFLLAVGILTPHFAYIPKATLSAVIIFAVIFMIEYEVVKPLWRCSRRELLPGAVTFILSLGIRVEVGLSAGVATDKAFLIHRSDDEMILKKATSDSIHILENAGELDNYELGADDLELKQVIAPLLQNGNEQKVEKRK